MVRTIDVDLERQLGEALYATLTSEQRAFVDVVIGYAKDYAEGVWNGSRCLFLSGEGGTGLIK